LFIFALAIMVILLILQSRKINDFTNLINKLDNQINNLDNQINNLTNQFDKPDILFNQNITYLNRSMNDNMLKHDSNSLNNEK